MKTREARHVSVGINCIIALLLVSSPSADARRNPSQRETESRTDSSLTQDSVLNCFLNYLDLDKRGSVWSLLQVVERADQISDLSRFRQHPREREDTPTIHISTNGISPPFVVHSGRGLPEYRSSTNVLLDRDLERIRAVNRALLRRDRYLMIYPEPDAGYRLVLLGLKPFPFQSDTAYEVLRLEPRDFDMLDLPLMFVTDSFVFAAPLGWRTTRLWLLDNRDTIIREFETGLPWFKQMRMEDVSPYGWMLIAQYLSLQDNQFFKGMSRESVANAASLHALVACYGPHELSHRNLKYGEVVPCLADIAYGPHPRESLGGLLTIKLGSATGDGYIAVKRRIIDYLPAFMEKNSSTLRSAGIDPSISPVGQLHLLSNSHLRAFAADLLGHRPNVKELYGQFSNPGLAR